MNGENKTFKKSIHLTILVGFLFALFAVALAWPISPILAQTVAVKGTLTSPSGEDYISGAYVYLHDSGWYTYRYYNTSSDGYFEFSDLASGTYTVDIYAAWPWDKSYSPPPSFTVTVVSGEVTDLGTIKFKEDNVYGKIINHEGTALDDFYVSASSSNYTNYAYKYTKSDGTFSLYLPNAGSYTLWLWDSTWTDVKFYSPGNQSFTLDSQDQSYDLGTINGKSPNVTGKFLDKNSNAISSGYPNAYLYNYNWSVSKYSYVNTSTGKFEFYAPAGTYTLSLYGGNGAQDPDPQAVTVKEGEINDLGTIKQPSPNVFLTLVEKDGVTPVSGAYAYLHNTNWTIYKYATSNSSGLFEFSLSTAGTYAVDIYSYHATQADPDPYSITYAAQDTVTATLQLQTSAMKVKVVDPDNNAVPYASISVHNSNWTSNGWGYTDSIGEAVIKKSLSTGTYTVSLYYYSYSGTSQLVVPDDFTIDLVKGEMNTYYYDHPIQLTEPVKTIAVNVKYPDGTAVTDATVSGWKNNGNGWFYGTVDSNGSYATKTASGEWNVSAYPNWYNGSPNWGYFESAKNVKFEQASDVEETQTVEFEVIPYSATIKGKVLNPDGSVPSVYTSVSVYNDGGYWNWSQVSSTDGSWSVKAPAGTFNIQIYSSNYNYGAPDLASWSVGDNETLDIGTIYLLEKKEHIVATTVDTNGNVLANQYVYAWKEGGSWGWASGSTDANGQVDLNVTQGKWTVMAYSGWWYGGQTVQYVSLESSKIVELSAEETENVSFEFGVANATIKGSLQDADGNAVSEYGWISVSNAANNDNYYSGLGCSVSGGSFECKVPAGTWTITYWSWNSDYDVVGSQEVEIGDSETIDGIVITLSPTNSTIYGSLVDQDGNLVDMNASIFAENGAGSYKYDWSYDGTYELKVSANTWTVGAWVDWYSDYIVSPSQDKETTVGEDEDKEFNIVLVKEDSEVSGKVTDEEGNPLQNMWVSLETKRGEETTSSYYMYYNDYEFGGFSDQNGNYAITAPSGEWYVVASAPADSGYMNPESVKVNIDSSSPAAVDFVFRTANANVSGTVKLNEENHQAYVYGWSDAGSYSETSTQDGSFTLPIFAPDTWHVGALYEDNNNKYYQAAEITIIAEEEEKTYLADLILLESDLTIPDAQTITFDSGNTVTIELSDGTRIIIPAYAILDETDRLITITVTPQVENVPRTSTARPIALMYDLKAVYADQDNAGEEIPSFASNVTIELPYTDEMLEELGVEISEIEPLYWDSTAGDYRNVNNVVVDEENHLIKFTINHFTLFGILAGGAAAASESLPAVSLTLPPDGAVVSVPQVVVAGTVSDFNATVDIELNGELKENPAPASNGSFETTISGLVLGENALAVWATNNAGISAEVTRTIVYSVQEEEEDIGNDTPEEIATAIVKDILVMPEEGSPQIRIFDQNGEVKQSFFAYSPVLRENWQVITRDMDGDGHQEILTGTENGLAPHIRVFDDQGSLITQFFPYDINQRFGVQLATADLTGSNFPELLIWPKGTAGTHLKIYRFNQELETFDLLAEEFLYGEDFRGTMNITVSDVTGDGKIDIIASPTANGTSHIRVFNYANGRLSLITQFFAYGEELIIGSKVMTGDLDGNGVNDLIVAPQYELAGSNVRAYQYNSNTESFDLMDWVMAFEDEWRGAMNIRVADLDNDDQAEIITAPHGQGGPNVRIYEYNNLSEQLELVDWFMAYSEVFHGGVDFVITNLDNDDYNEIVTTPRRSGGPNLRIYEYDPTKKGFMLRDWALTHNEEYRGQLNVAVTDLLGDGDSELIIAPREMGTGGPNIRLFDWQNDRLEFTDWFWGFAETFRGGVNITTINQPAEAEQIDQLIRLSKRLFIERQAKRRFFYCAIYFKCYNNLI